MEGQRNNSYTRTSFKVLSDEFDIGLHELNEELFILENTGGRFVDFLANTFCHIAIVHVMSDQSQKQNRVSRSLHIFVHIVQQSYEIYGLLFISDIFG